jgi:transposase
MAFREVGIFEVKEVLRLFLSGMPKKTVARTVGVDPKTVRRYVSAAEELGIGLPLDDGKLSRVFESLRADSEREHGKAYLKCREHAAFIRKLIDDGVRLTKVRKLLQRQHSIDVPYSALYRFAVKELSFRVEKSVRLMDPPKADEVQIDTGVVITLNVDGKEVKKKAFIFTPTVSRYRFVHPIDRETTEAAIEACEAAWAFYGGVFEIVSPDNTKAIVDEASSTSPIIIDAFREYAQARGITVDPTRVRHPKDKARVEKTVAFVRDDCFGGEDIVRAA